MMNEHCFAQITDCHLYADKKALHYGANVYANLCHILSEIKVTACIEFIVFTGDLTQDHTELSYQNFVDAVNRVGITIPLYFLAGNHDDNLSLTTHLSKSPFAADKSIELDHWQVLLVDSKSDTPAGYIKESEIDRLLCRVQKTKHQLVLLHHHPMHVGYFIDKHGLTNQKEFLSTLNQIDNLKGVGCGHVHNAMEFSLYQNQDNKTVPLFTCPATSIQFEKSPTHVINSGTSPGYRLYYLKRDGHLSSVAKFVTIAG